MNWRAFRSHLLTALLLLLVLLDLWLAAYYSQGGR